MALAKNGFLKLNDIPEITRIFIKTHELRFQKKDLLQKLAASTKEITLDENYQYIIDNDKLKHFYIIIDGKIKSYKTNDKTALVSGHVSNNIFQCFGNMEFIGIYSKNIESFHTITQCRILEIDTTNHMIEGKAHFEENSFIVSNLQKYMPAVKLLGLLTFNKFSSLFKIRKLHKGEIFQYKDKAIKKVYQIVQGECQKLIFINPQTQAFSNRLFNGIQNVNFFSETLSKYRICNCIEGEWVNFEYIFGYTDDYRCPYNLVATQETILLEISRISFSKNLAPTIKKGFHDKAIKIIENQEPRLREIEETGKSVMNITLDYDVDQAINETQNDMLKLSKTLAKKELMEYLKNPDNSMFRKYIRDLREMVYSVKKSTFYSECKDSITSKTVRDKILNQRFTCNEILDFGNTLKDNEIASLSINKTPILKKKFDRKESSYSAYQSRDFTNTKDKINNIIGRDSSEKNKVAPETASSRLNENCIKKAFIKIDQNNVRASSANSRSKNVRGYLNLKNSKALLQRRPESAQVNRHVRFADNKHVSSQFLNDSRIRSLSRDHITPISHHCKEVEQLIVETKNDNQASSKKNNYGKILSINDSLLNLDSKKTDFSFSICQRNNPSFSKPETENNLLVKKINKIDTKSTMNSQIDSKKNLVKDSDENNQRKTYKLKKNGYSAVSIDLKHLKNKGDLLKGNETDVFSHFTKESKLEKKKKIQNLSGRAQNELKKQHESTDETNITENNETNNSAIKNNYINAQFKRNFNILYNNIQDQALKISSLNMINDEIKTNMHIPSKNDKSGFVFHFLKEKRRDGSTDKSKALAENYKDLRTFKGNYYKTRPKSTHQRIAEKSNGNNEIRTQLASIFQKARKSFYV